jgi:hypothetical protein
MSWFFQPLQRPWTVWIFFTVFLMGMFWLFAYGWGWPPIVDKCVANDMSCYCEQFKISASQLMANEASGTWWKGVMQPVNTYSNLYAIISAGYVACRLWRDRKAGGLNNVLTSNWWMGDVWVFCVLFLGLGSMWFHGSISGGVSWFDSFSMYVFTGFMVFYTLDRGFAQHPSISPRTRTLVFWIGYPLLVVVFTLISLTGASSEALIGITLGLYAAAEIFAKPVFCPWANGDWKPLWGWLKPLLLWLGGLAAFVFAAISRAQATVPGDPWCTPDSFWQPHGLLWHTFSGVMALCLFFYWREDRGGAGTLPQGYQ